MSVAALRSVKVALIAAVALWGAVAVMHNLLNWSGTLGAVKAATSMSTFEGGVDSWQATASPLVVWLGALFIVAGKLAAAVLCGAGAVGMLRTRHMDAAGFAPARRTAMAGCGIALFMLFTGFVVVAETWFELWRSDALRGPVLDSALRYAALIALIALFVGMGED